MPRNALKTKGKKETYIPFNWLIYCSLVDISPSSEPATRKKELDSADLQEISNSI